MASSTILRRSALASATLVALSVGAMSERAAAAVYAGASLETSDLSIVISGSVTSLGFTFDMSNDANLNGTDDNESATCSGTAIPVMANNCGADPALDADQAFVTDSEYPKPPENTFALTGPLDPNESYARSDSIIDDAQVTGDARTRTRNVAEAEVKTRANSQDGDATSEISSDTGFTFSFDLGETGSLVLDFDAARDLMVDIGTDAFPFALARAGATWKFTLSNDADGSEIEWEPDGTIAAGDCMITDNGNFAGVSCTETDDDFDLNKTITVSSIPSDMSESDTGDFGISITGLPEGTHTLVLQEVKDIRVTNGAPTPGVLSLLGAGLLGLGWSRRRRV